MDMLLPLITLEIPKFIIANKPNTIYLHHGWVVKADIKQLSSIFASAQMRMST